MTTFRGGFIPHLKELFALRAFLRLCAAIACALLAGFFLLFLAASLPNAKLDANLESAAKSGYFAENYPIYYGMRSLDMYTECVAIGLARELRPTLTDITAARHFGECAGLSAAIANGFSSGAQAYPRYIHGYQIILKPLYTLLPVQGVRAITALVSALLLAALFFTARRRLGPAYALLLLGSFLFIRSPHVFLLVTHAVQFWVVLAGCIAALRHTKSDAPVVLFGLIGACDAFVSFLSMGSLSLGLPILCYCLARWSDGEAPARILASAFWASAGWGIGFVVPWFAKWGLTLAVLPAQDILGRTVVQYPARGLGMIFKAMLNNLKATRWPLWAGAFVLLAVRLRLRKISIPQGLWVVLFAALVPLVWVCLLPGQSGIKHTRFVHILVLPLLTSILCLLAALPPKAKNFKIPTGHKHGRPEKS